MAGQGATSDSMVVDFKRKFSSIFAQFDNFDLKNLLLEFYAVWDSRERLLEALPFLVSDLQLLCDFHYVVLSPTVLNQCKTLISAYPGVESKEEIPTAVRPLSQTTLDLFRRPLLTPTDYNLMTSLVQSHRSSDSVEFRRCLDHRNREYFRYEILFELRAAFYCAKYILSHRELIDTEHDLADWAHALFQEQGPLLKMHVFRKMNWAVRLRKSLNGSQDAYRNSEFDFEKLLLQVGEVLGPSGEIFYDHARALYNCERWLGVTRVDLVVKHLSIKRPELQSRLKEAFVKWKDCLVEMHDARRQLWNLAFSSKEDLVLEEPLYEEILISIGMYGDFMGTLTMVKDLMKRVRETGNVRLFAQLNGLLLRRLLGGIRKYQCWGQGEFINTEKVIQVLTLEITLELQQYLRSAPPRGQYLPLEVFLAAVVVYRELLLILFEEKNRDHVKASERDLLAETPSLPNSMFLFDKKLMLSSTGAKIRLVPNEQTWEPYVAHYQFQPGSLTRIFESGSDLALDKLNTWLTLGLMEETAHAAS